MKKNEAVKTRTSATPRQRPAKDLAVREAPTGGTGGITVAMGDGSVRFVR